MSDLAELSSAAVLNRAADYIEKHGWVRGASGEENGRVCASVALLKVCGLDPCDGLCPERDAFVAARGFLVEVIGNLVVSQWNDAQPSGEPVIAALRAAAQAAS